ncbi:organic solvent tolerance protein OstA [Methylobacterium organophilum]|uniref:LptA/OstA family protein n=1 Tax=Methylobacterium organophilum TaxID=410 RepID=UPI001F1318B1|nr:LptA/OstA family protein [Methylobacterium organophilum]UMY18965.1 organic solvent tolerance protein OstA [Methylobacterium organophilum]
MTRLPLRLLLAGLVLSLAAAPAAVQAQSDAKKSGLGAFGAGGKEPIKIDADRLDVFDRESKAIFAGNVVAVQGDSTIRCSAMTVFYKRGKEGGKDASKDAAKDKDAAAGESASSGESAAAMAENGIRKVECAGPVTVVQKDQVATGDNAVFDQTARRIVLTGNVVLSQCQNVTRGSRLVYDMNTGRANMDPVAGGRVSAMFVPGQKDDAKGGAKGCPPPPGTAKAAPKPAEGAKSAEVAKSAEGAKPTEAAGRNPGGKTRAQAN